VNFRHWLIRSAALATASVALFVAGGVARAQPADPQSSRSSDEQDNEPRLQCPSCSPEIQQMLKQLGPVPDVGPMPWDGPAPVQVSVPVSAGLPPVGLPGFGSPSLQQLQQLPPPPALPPLPPPPPLVLPPPPGPPALPPPPELPRPPWPFG
jgi:formin 2/Wiskott-Aldrich syndrome protein